MSKRIWGKWAAVFILVAAIGIGFSTASFAADPIKINFISYLNLKQYDFAMWKPLIIDKVNKEAKGEVEIVVRGGPEAIPLFDQAMAVKNGVVDMMYTSVGFYSSLIPGIDSIRLSEISPQEERKNGTFEYIQKMAEKQGLKYLGRGLPSSGGFFWVFLRKKAEKPEDFKGMKIGGSPSFAGLIKGLGATPVSMPLTDYYTAVERGVIDGHIGSISVWVGIGTYEIAKYVPDYPYWSTTAAIMFNLKKWNSLPAHAQKVIDEAVIEQEKAWPAINDREEAKMKDKAIKAGAEFYKLSPETAKFFHKAAYDLTWQDDTTRFPAEIVNGMKALVQKK